MRLFAGLRLIALFQLVFVLSLTLGLWARPAGAQLLLHTAPLPASPATRKDAPGLNTGPQMLKPVAVSPPHEETILGRELTRAGAKGLIAFERGPDQMLKLTKLVMEGEENSAPFDDCRIDVSASAPLSVHALGRNAGLAHYEVELEACPFSFDLMNGAILVTHEPPQCNFKAANCLIDPAGLWGPAGTSFSDKQIKTMEHARALAESNMRANYRALQSSAGKDRLEIKRIAREQAGFSSEREVLCRNYDHEEVHGFCALQITQSRVLALQSEYNESALAGSEGKAARHAKPAFRGKTPTPSFPAAKF